MEELSLSNEFRRLWQGKDPFAEVDRLEGEVFRHVKSRKTIRFSTNGGTYFAKIHYGIGWLEIFKDLLQFKVPVLDAQNEWAALNLLRRIGVDTMTPAAFGRRGTNPARIQSFIITEELTQTRSLEEFCADWKTRPGPFQMRQALIERVASIVRQMHQHGMNHRDCYICHFHLDVSRAPDPLRLYVIDLHRAQLRRRTPRRWRIKDVAGLYFSAMDIGLTRSDRLRFMRAYQQEPLSDILRGDNVFWKRVERTAMALSKKHFHGST